MMSKKHFQQAADLIRGVSQEPLSSELSVRYAQGYTASLIAAGLAELFSQDNRNFDRNKFMEACFPAEETK